MSLRVFGFPEPNSRSLPTNSAPQIRVHGRKPRFLVSCEPVYRSFFSSLCILVSRGASKTLRPNGHPLRAVNVARSKIPGLSMGISFLLHCSIFLLFINLRGPIPINSPAVVSVNSPVRIYYRLLPLQAARAPRIAPRGPGGRPGSGRFPDRLPALGSTVSHSTLTIVSKPSHPDNFHQTIIQPSSPPELRIDADLRLPTIITGQPLPSLRAPLTFSPSNAKPTQTHREVTVGVAPWVPSSNPSTPIVTFLQPSDTQPRLAIPVAQGGAPIQKSRVSSGIEAGSAPDVVGDGSGLLVVGVDSTGSGTQFDLPPGNRYGEFSTSPGGGMPGSPGGSPNGSMGGGAGGSGWGGDGSSTGIGSGGSGGGGGDQGSLGSVSIAGGRDSGGMGGTLGSLGSSFPASLVYPVAAAPLNLRKNMLIVLAGPVGGGGLKAYGAMHCGKIYTVFLPMPGKAWTMQYCRESNSSEGVSVDSGSTVIHLKHGIIAPDPDPASRFDFKRLPVPTEQAHKMIILKGVIKEDGSIESLEVYQGVLPAMDEAARLAFRQWKFKPAMHEGKPIPVQILVGIPPVINERYTH